jgi:hypothetical protein
MGCAGSKQTACQVPEVIHATELDSHEPGAGHSAVTTTGKHADLQDPERGDTNGKLSDVSTASGSNDTTPSGEAESTLHIPPPFIEPAGEEPCNVDNDQEENDSALDVAKQAMAEATELFEYHKVLQAEEVLARALARLKAGELGGDAEEAASDIISSDVYARVHRRCRQYDDLKKSLGERNESQKLVWEGEGSQLWVFAPAGESWFEYKVICDIDAPLTHCIAYGTEVDMIPEYEPNIIGEPQLLGDVNPFVTVMRLVIGVLILRVELIYEICRFWNTEHGFLGESVNSKFDEEGRSVPPRHWRNKRVKVSTQFLWIPKGGGEKGTVAVQTTRAEAGFRIPDWCLKFFISQFAPTMVGNLRKNSLRVGAPNSPYASRLAQDKLGVYAECAKVEEAAARRETISATSLPSEEWLRREWKLTEPPTSQVVRALSEVSQL